ncbi:MAG: hypothetical protein IJT66_03025 [Clostridia bacterium]|nr:hypothetical protein [Clostridia bacterium]
MKKRWIFTPKSGSKIKQVKEAGLQMHPVSPYSGRQRRPQAGLGTVSVTPK